MQEISPALKRFQEIKAKERKAAADKVAKELKEATERAQIAPILKANPSLTPLQAMRIFMRSQEIAKHK